MINDNRIAVIANDVRLSIVEILLERPHRVGQLAKALGKSASLISHHLRVLQEEGFVESRPDGKGRMYSILPSVRLPMERNGVDLGCCTIELHRRKGNANPFLK